MSNNGKHKSAIESSLKMSEAQAKRVSAALEKVFRRFNEAGPMKKDRRTHDFVFHMTDWYDDLVRLAGLFEDPEKYDQKAWDSVVFAFLNHAVAHLLAAAKLNDTVICPFEIPSSPIKSLPRKRTKIPSLA